MNQAGGDKFARVQPGQKRVISAAVWNAMLDTIDTVRGQQRSGLSSSLTSTIDTTILVVENTSEADVDRFGILGIDGPVFEPADALDEFLSRPAVQGVIPSDPEHLGRFCITLEPIAAGQIGRAVFAGVVPVQISVSIDDDCQWADVIPIAESYGQPWACLKTRRTGSAQILWRESGYGGTKWALVRIGQDRRAALRCSAQFKGAMASGAGTCTIDNVVPLDGGRGPVLSATDQLTIRNGSSYLDRVFYSAADNAECVIVWNPRIGANGLASTYGSWELEPPAEIRFEMTAALGCGGVAEVVVRSAYDDVTEWYRVNAYDAAACFSKMATTSGDTGAMGVAIWSRLKTRYEIATMQTPGDFWGTLQSDLHRTDSSVTVAIAGSVLGGYSVFKTNHGPTITAYNPANGSNDAAYTCWHQGANGDRVYCHWDMKAAKYWILAVEPNAQDWQTHDVVTRTTLAIDFDAKTFSKHDYTRQIKIPPWASIGDEEER